MGLTAPPSTRAEEVIYTPRWALQHMKLSENLRTHPQKAVNTAISSCPTLLLTRIAPPIRMLSLKTRITTLGWGPVISQRRCPTITPQAMPHILE